MGRPRRQAREQARIPLFDAREMGNADEAALARRLAAAPYAALFRQAFSAPGRDVFADPQQVVAWAALAFEVLRAGPEFAPFDSRYDRFLAGRATLSPAELRGLAMYRDPAKATATRAIRAGAPATAARRCSPTPASSRWARRGARTCRRWPRRAAIAPRPRRRTAQRPTWACAARARPGLTDDPGFCGRFRTPTLRNVALRASFFHNGSVHSLREAVAFYATRDTDPAHWYSKNADGSVRIYDDLPAAMAIHVNREAPFAPLPGGRPRLDDRDIDDIVAFLRTLTDADVDRDAGAASGRAAR